MPPNRPAHPTDPSAKPGGILCPYCGNVSANPRRCDACAGFFDPLSRQASQNAMGPWFFRDHSQPFRPGCSYETLKELIRRGRVNRSTVLRGPTTRQFWSFAGRTPSVANLLGLCHNCQAEVAPDSFACTACGAAFSPETDRQHLGLAPVHLLPGQAPPEIIAASASADRSQRAAQTRPQPAPSPVVQSESDSPGATKRPTFWIAIAIAGGAALAVGAAVVNWALNQPAPAPGEAREQTRRAPLGSPEQAAQEDPDRPAPDPREAAPRTPDEDQGG
jgi:hypothetical protein